MRKNTTEPTETQAQKPVEEPKVKKTKAPVRSWRPLMILGVLMFLAAFVRVAFSFSVSAGSDFALSGGTDASNNLRFIESIVEYHKIRFTDNWLNYPEGSLIVIPVLFDALMAAVAMLVNVFMDDPVKASSFALAISGPVFGVLACIPMYFVGKEMFSSKVAGYAAAAFLALCPVFVQESVFSNGTGTSFAVFLFLFGIYFLIRALKVPQGDAVSAYKTAGIAGIFIAAAMGSWIDFRQVAIPLVIVMIAQTLIDRFKGRDPRPAAMVYSIAMAVGFILPCIGYSIVGYFTALISGTLIMVVLAIAFTLAYSVTYKKPWVLTLPVCAGVCLLVLLVIAIVSPSLYGCIVSGNNYYDPAVVDMMGRQYLTLSQLTAYYGVVTYWFVFLVFLYMVFRFLRNSGSPVYVFTLFWLFVMTLTLGHDSMQAAFAAPVFALGFAVIVKIVLEHVNFKAYFSGIKTGADAKVRLKRVFSPVPLLAILIAVFLVAGPNMMQVIDAGISSNDVDDYNDQISDVTGNDQFGTLSYYIKTDDTWTVRDALAAVKGGYGAVASWMSYSDDVKIYANMKSYTDTYGHGTDVASNILLSNGVNGSSAAAILLTAIMNKGCNDDTRAKLTGAGFSAADVDLIYAVIDSVDYKPFDGDRTVREIVISDYSTYGAVVEDISDRNVQYLFLEDYIATNYHSADINAAYDKFGMRNPYIMVTGDMMPFFVGYSSVFDQMAILNDYSVDMSYGTVSKFTTFGYMAYYYGIYDFTTAMYDTMLYRAYIGMTPTEAGYSSLYEYLAALSSADASVQMHPGYGLSNYEVAYWHVKYNASNNATTDSDGWEDMDAKEAIDLQKANGGRINYLDGSPVILRYVSSTAGTIVSGTVTDSTASPAEDIRVVAVDADGVVRATTHTSADGTYKIYVPDKANSTLVFYAGAGTASSGGTIVAVKAATEPNVDGVVLTADISITLGGSNIVNAGTLLYDVKIVNEEADTTDSYTAGDAIASGTFTVGVGSQKITISSDDSEVASATFNVDGTTAAVDVSVNVYDYTVTVVDIYGAYVPGANVHLNGAVSFDHVTDDKGTYKFENVPKGSYDIQVDGYYVSSPSVDISSTTSKNVTVNAAVSMSITAPAAGVSVYVYGDAFSASQVFDVATTSMILPKSGISDTKYTIYCLYDGKIYSALAASSAASVDLTEKNLATVSGMLKNADGDAVSGTVYFVTADGEKYKCSADTEKGYKAYVPEGELLVYATNNSEAYIGAMTFASGNNTDKEITMQKADKISSSAVGWGGTYYSYVMVDVTVAGKALPLMTSSGSYSFYLPRGMGADVNITPTAVYNAVPNSVADDHESDKSLTGSLTLTDAISLKVNNDMGAAFDDYDLTISTTRKVSAWATEPFSVTSNSRTITLKSEDDSVYYSGSHKFNPEAIGAATTINLSDLLNKTAVNDMTYYTVTVADYTSDYNIKVYYGEDTSEYSTVSGTTATRVALVSDSTVYRIEIVKSDKTQVLRDVYAAAPAAYSVADCVPATELTGYIGANVDTEMTFTELPGGTNWAVADITDGTYSIVLKRDTEYGVLLNKTVSGTFYTLNQTLTLSGETMKHNFQSTAAPAVYNVDASAHVTTSGKVSKAVFEIPANQISNTTDDPESFTFSPGSGWLSYSFTIGGAEVSEFKLAPGAGNQAISFVGYFNSALYEYGTSDLAIKVDGSTDSMQVNFTNYGGTAGLILVNKASDDVGDYTYEFEYTLVNTGTSQAEVAVDVSGFTVPEGWVMFYKLENDIGTYIHAPAATESIAPGSTSFSVVLMPVASSSDVPSGTVEFTSANGIGTSTPEKITVSEGKATSSATPGAAEVSVTDISASGRDVVNDKGKVPTIVWVMIAAMALLIILIFWMASKRGVFARKK